MRWPSRTSTHRAGAEPDAVMWHPAAVGLVVPPGEQHAARSRGALWDPGAGRFVVPAGCGIPRHRFKRWFDSAGPLIDEGPFVGANPLAVGRRCYRCGARTAAIVGVLLDDPQWSLDPCGFVGFETVAEELAEEIDEDFLVLIGFGPLRWRRSRQEPHGYVSNGCRQCDAIQGNFFLAEELGQYLAGGGTYEDLRTDFGVEIPTALLTWAMGE